MRSLTGWSASWSVSKGSLPPRTRRPVSMCLFSETTSHSAGEGTGKAEGSPRWTTPSLRPGRPGGYRRRQGRADPQHGPVHGGISGEQRPPVGREGNRQVLLHQGAAATLCAQGPAHGGGAERRPPGDHRNPAASAGAPWRFILFCDDLAFDEGEVSYRELKAILEGGIEARPENVLLYATSNRRHLMPEPHE